MPERVRITGKGEYESIDAQVDASGRLQTSQGNYSIIGDGVRTVSTAGNPVQISVVSVPCKLIILTGVPINTGAIWAGTSTVSASNYRGRIIYAAQSVEFLIDNLNKLYIDADVSGERVGYIYYN